jgi:hypothetical protein
VCQEDPGHPATAELALQTVGVTQRGLKLFEKLAHEIPGLDQIKNLGPSQVEGYTGAADVPAI